jgi:hypothetical protein
MEFRHEAECSQRTEIIHPPAPPVDRIMNNGTLETSPADRSSHATRSSHDIVNFDELARLKRELLQAEVRLAKACATMAGAEVDIKVLNARLKALMK